ncbi:MAG: hypothetical protein DRG50_06660, partial [Deltaproteobacteria bacterium]
MVGKERIREVLRKKDLEGILIFSAENIRYLTGFTGTEGFLLAVGDENILMVDGRYIIQAQEEAKECRILLLEKGIEGVAAYISSLGLKQVGFEAEGVSVALFDKLRHRMREVELVPVGEELERLRGVKTKEEIFWIKGAIKIAEGAWEKILEMVKPGTREDELALEFEYMMKK